MSTWHKLLSKDAEALTGVCSVCGPVDIVLRPSSYGRRYWRCGTARRTSGLGGRSRHHGVRYDEAKARVRGNPCEICGDPAKHLDHNHTTGQIRGVLCVSCNVQLLPLLETHLAGEMERRITAARAYLASYTQPQT